MLIIHVYNIHLIY